LIGQSSRPVAMATEHRLTWRLPGSAGSIGVEGDALPSTKLASKQTHPVVKQCGVELMQVFRLRNACRLTESRAHPRR
jgi:hypothetical protein